MEDPTEMFPPTTTPYIDDILSNSKYTIYYIDVLDNVTRSVIDNYKDIYALLINAGVKEADILRANINSQSDLDLYEYIEAKCGGIFRPPVVFMGNEFLGDYHTLANLNNNGKLQEVVKTNSLHPLLTSPGTSKERDTGTTHETATAATSKTENGPQLRAIDTALEIAETVVDYINPFSYWRAVGKWFNGAEADSKKEQFLDMELIHTNWYGRNQKRKFRFCTDELLRIHPNGTIRAVYKYSSFTRVQRLDDTKIIIYNSTGGSPDWVGGSQKEISTFVDLLKAKVPALVLTQTIGE